jgi:hypothetical protein
MIVVPLDFHLDPQSEQAEAQFDLWTGDRNIKLLGASFTPMSN